MNVTTTVRAMALSDPQFESLPVKREMVFPLGEPASNDDRQWRFTRADLESCVAEFGKRPDKYMAVDYAHGKDPVKGLRAAGWIDHLEVGADGLYAHIRYTDEALAEIGKGEWGYRSPEWEAPQYPDGAYGALRLSKLSLVNDPAIGGMPPIQAATQPAATTHGEQEEEPTMADLTSVTAAKKSTAAFDKAGLLSTIRETFAMPEAISDDMLVDLLKKAIEDVVDALPDEMAKEAENPAAPPIEAPALASARPRIELVEDPKDTARIIASVQKAASLGTITPQTLEAAGKLAGADIESFERIFCQPPAPAAGRLINASAKDRSAKAPTHADTVRAARNAAVGAR